MSTVHLLCAASSDMRVAVFTFLASLVQAQKAQTESLLDGSSGPCHVVSMHNATKFPESFLKPSEINRCMAHIALDPVAAMDAVNGTLALLDIYSYEFYAIDDHNPQLPLHVNVQAELANLQKDLTTIESMPEFSRRISNLLNRLEDGHTEIAIDCSARISYDAFLPIANIAASWNATAKVVVHPQYDQFLIDRKINDTSQFDLQRSIAGSTILEIDGVDAEAYLINQTMNPDSIFGNIDPQTHYNQLFVNLRGAPTPRLGYGVAFYGRGHVDKDELRLKVLLLNGTESEVSIPWLGIVDTDYHKLRNHNITFERYYSDYICSQKGSPDIFSANITKLPSKSNSLQALDSRQHTSRVQPYLYDREYSLVHDAPSPSPFAFHYRKMAQEPEIKPSSATVLAHGGQLENITNLDSGFDIFHFSNTTVGVLYYTNFDGGDKTTNSTLAEDSYARQYSHQMTKGLRELKSRGVDTLIIDVSGNNGGRTELGSLAILSLFPGQYPGFASVIRSNPEMIQFLNGSDYEQSFMGVDGKPYRTLTDLTSQGNHTLSINGVNASYSQLLLDNLKDSENWQIIAKSKFPTEQLFSPSNMMLVTNGKCASTCAQVAMYLQDVHGVKSAGFGGMPGYEHLLQTVGGVRGAQVVELLDPTDPSQNLYNFTMRVSQMTVNFRSAIHYERKIPTEYVTRNVDYIYQHTLDTFANFANTWQFVAEKHFPRAMKTAPKPPPDSDIDWVALRDYPPGWFSRVQALQSSMTR